MGNRRAKDCTSRRSDELTERTEYTAADISLQQTSSDPQTERLLHKYKKEKKRLLRRVLAIWKQGRIPEDWPQKQKKNLSFAPPARRIRQRRTMTA